MLKPWRNHLGRALIRVGTRLANCDPQPVEAVATVLADPNIDEEVKREQVRQLVKEALETPSPQELAHFLDFTTRFRRLSVWNARMAYIQRPGAKSIATEHEWLSVGRRVLPDAVPIIILWPFSPIRYVYELADTGPPIDREQFCDPFATSGKLDPRTLRILEAALKKQKTFHVEIEPRRQGFNLAGSASVQGSHLRDDSEANPLDAGGRFGPFAQANADTHTIADETIHKYRVTVNDRLSFEERFVTICHELGHIFCGHLGGCSSSPGKNDESGWPDRRGLDKRGREVEAEAVAFLVASRAGLTARSAEYLNGYVTGDQMPGFDLDIIVRAAARIERLAKLQYGTLSVAS